jgi:hypothetical protein
MPNIERWPADQPPDFPDCVIALIDALKNYKQWIIDFSDKPPSTEQIKHLADVQNLITYLEGWEVNSQLRFTAADHAHRILRPHKK